MTPQPSRRGLATKAAVLVLLIGGVPSLFFNTPWQGWLLFMGLAVIAFLIVSVLTRRSRV